MLFKNFMSRLSRGFNDVIRNRWALRGAAVLAVAAIVGIVAALGSKARAEDKAKNAAGEWGVFYAEAKSGIRVCSVVRLFPTGEWVHLNRLSDGVDLLTVYAPGAPALEKKSAVASVSLVFKGEENEKTFALPEPGVALAMNGLEGVMVKLNDTLLDQLGSASAFTMSYGGFTTKTLSLKDASAGIAAIDKCRSAHFPDQKNVSN